MRSFALALILLVPAFSSAGEFPLTGAWRSAPEETPLTTAFDESVWGKNAKAIRLVEMSVRPTGEATLTVTRRVVDAKGRTVRGSMSIEQADLTLGAVQNTNGVRSELATTVKHAERRYPDDPAGTWKLDGLRVEVSTFSDNAATIEVRVDFPEGRGSFWESLRRAGRKPAATTSQKPAAPAGQKPAAKTDQKPADQTTQKPASTK